MISPASCAASARTNSAPRNKRKGAETKHKHSRARRALLCPDCQRHVLLSQITEQRGSLRGNVINLGRHTKSDSKMHKKLQRFSYKMRIDK